MSDAATPLVVDVHAHALVIPALELVANEPAAIAAREREGRLLGASQTRQQEMVREVMPLLVDVQSRLRAMDEARIDVQLVSPSPAHYHEWAPSPLSARVAQLVNEGVVELCAQAPERLVGLGLAPIHDPELAVKVLEHAVTTLGLRGVEIPTTAPGRELGDPCYEDFWRRAQELDALVFIHPWGCTLGERLGQHFLYNIVGQPVETTVALSHIIFSGVLDRYPQLRIIAAHGGGYLPFYPGRADHAWRERPELTSPQEPPSHYLRHIYFDTLVHSPDLLAVLVDRVGYERVLLGSDFPFDMGSRDPLDEVNQVPGLSDEQRASICGLSAAKLLGLI